MFDTMTLNKIVAGVCGTFLIFLLAKWAATSIYTVGDSHGEHGDHGEHKQAYIIEVPDAPAAGEEVVEIAFADVFATADAAKGERVFNKCKACHKLDGTNGTGPALNGIVDKAVGSVASFSYSNGMAGFGGAWTPEILNEFILKPKALISDTKMSFAGLRKVEERADLIAYLQTVN